MLYTVYIYIIYIYRVYLVSFILNGVLFALKLEQPIWLAQGQRQEEDACHIARAVQGTVFVRSHHWLSSTHRWHSTRRPGDQYPQDQLPPRQVSESFYFDVSDFIFLHLCFGENPLQDLFWNPQKFPSLCDPPRYAQSMPVSSKYRRSKHQTIPVANRMLALGSPKVPISRSLRFKQSIRLCSIYTLFIGIAALHLAKCLRVFLQKILVCSYFVYKANHHLSTQFLSRSFQMCAP